MDDSLPLVFRVFQIIIPTFAVIIFCTAFCKCLVQSRRRRREQTATRARAQEAPSSVYIIPFSPSEEHHHGPPRYSPEQLYTPPPPYSQLAVKPDFPHDPPPSYTESVSPPFISSDPRRIVPSCPTTTE